MNLHEQPAIPISFSPAMVEAILSGRKSQTRRIITTRSQQEGALLMNMEAGRKLEESKSGMITRHSPFGKPGSILWIREEHRLFDTVGTWHCEFKDGTITRHLESDIPADTLKRLKARKTLGKWQRARFLPRYFARTYLKVTDIQVEQLQDITEEDAIAEGAEERYHRCGGFGYYEAGGEIYDCTCQSFINPPVVEGFKDLWESINGPNSWEASPWVWVVRFEKI